jgi:hypothetical protein
MSEIAEKTQRLSAIAGRAKIFTTALAVATPILFAWVAIDQGLDALIPVPAGVPVDLGDQSVGGLALLTILAALKPAAFFAVLWRLRGLFGLYRNQIIFEPRAIRCVRHIGWLLILVDAADAAQRIAAGPVLTALDAAEPFFTVSVGLSFSIVGVFVIVIARIMDIGRELKSFEELAI